MMDHKEYHEKVTRCVELNERTGGLASNMTLRDHFAGQAMSAAIREEEWMQMHDTANFAYEQADAMLEARKVKGKGKT